MTKRTYNNAVKKFARKCDDLFDRLESLLDKHGVPDAERGSFYVLFDNDREFGYDFAMFEVKHGMNQRERNRFVCDIMNTTI